MQKIKSLFSLAINLFLTTENRVLPDETGPKASSQFLSSFFSELENKTNTELKPFQSDTNNSHQGTPMQLKPRSGLIFDENSPLSNSEEKPPLEKNRYDIVKAQFRGHFLKDPHFLQNLKENRSNLFFQSLAAKENGQQMNSQPQLTNRISAGNEMCEEKVIRADSISTTEVSEDQPPSNQLPDFRSSMPSQHYFRKSSGEDFLNSNAGSMSIVQNRASEGQAVGFTRPEKKNNSLIQY